MVRVKANSKEHKCAGLIPMQNGTTTPNRSEEILISDYLNQCVKLAMLLVSLCLFSFQSQAADKALFDPMLYSALEWRNPGPHRGGRVTAVAGITEQPYTFYMGATGGGVWKTKDAGVSWKNISDGFFDTSSIGAIAVADSDANVIYIGTGESPIRNNANTHGDGVYKSTDAGKTWSKIGLSATRHISAIRIHQENPDIVYVAAQGNPWGPNAERGIYRTMDGGETWTLVLHIDETTGASDLSMNVTNPRILYAAFWDYQRVPWQIRSGGPGSGIHKTTDGGETWTKLSEGLPAEMGKIGISVSPANPDRVWAMIEAEEGGVFRSDDAGKNWTRSSGAAVLRTRAWYYNHIMADPGNADTVYVMNLFMIKSIDGGKTFHELSTPHSDTHSLWINPNNTNIMINGNDGGATVSLNAGLTWSTQLNQPTAQFYRLITDNRFPYYLYAGQQDNTTLAIPSRNSGSGIDQADWYTVGGGESAHIAFDPDNPRFVYATSIVGIIDEFDQENNIKRNVQAFPSMNFGIDAKEMKYRFNWNAPVFVSPHDPATIYHAGNKLLRSQDRGRSWVEVSPDLTRNEPEKQGKGGVPFINESAGAEIYNTIFYALESPHEKGTIWVGTDDGLVHITRDGGLNWTDVTPRKLGEKLINAIEVSPHDPASAYLAVAGYRHNDFKPYIYKTENYGKSWKLLINGIDPSTFVRVVREDPVQAGLLYAGAENGMYVSFNGGQQWQSLQLKLPVVPITDLRVHGNDLVAATQGRAFWILDDISPLREVSKTLADTALHLYKPSHVQKLATGSGDWGAKQGKNPPSGALIYFYVKEELDTSETPVDLTILNDKGDVMRNYSTEPEPQAECYRNNVDSSLKAKSTKPFKIKQGMNRFVWNLRHANYTCIPDHFITVGWNGPTAAPGKYTARVTMGDIVQEQTFEVRNDPRLKFSNQAYDKQKSTVLGIYQTINDVHGSVNQIKKVASRIESIVEQTTNHDQASEISSSASELKQWISDWEQKVTQPKQKTIGEVVNYPTRLNSDLIYLMHTIGGDEPVPTKGMTDRLAELLAEWKEQKMEYDRFLSEDVKAFESKIEGLSIPRLSPSL